MITFLIGLLLVVGGGVSAVALRRAPGESSRWAFQGLVIAGCTSSAASAIRVLASGTAMSASMHSTVPGGDWIIGIDALSAIFLVVLFAVGAAVAVFGTYDLAREDETGHAEPASPAWLTQLCFAVLLVAIAMVVVARATIVFLSAWEIMAISSYLLIVTHHGRADVRRAGLIYLVATHTATLALFAMFATWQVHARDWSFLGLAAASPGLSAAASSTILVLALLGFGFKAGLVPLHFWLPPAHAAAPSHISALMSGLVIKTGIYGMLRVLLLLGGAPAWWGWVVLALGVASGILGVLWALAQHDVKRLLAYHSVENIGIILMGMGIGVLGVDYSSPAVAVLGFAGALLHTVNHAVFKSLLFLGAGAVYRVTGTRNMEELGGLARRMPVTWLGFLIGAASIIGVPPFNGFVSEWLVYQGLFAAGQARDALRLAVFGIPALGLIGALALACFSKVAGVVFLGAPRTGRAASATEVSRGGFLPSLFLAAICVAIGVIPWLGITLVNGGVSELARVDPSGVALGAMTSSAGMISIVALVSILLCGALWGLQRYVMRKRAPRYAETWGCGYDAVTPRMQYTASSFASPLLSLFGGMTGVRVERSTDALHTHPSDLVLDDVALPIWRAMHRAALRLRPIQQGRLYLYLIYVMAALLVLLAYLALGIRL